MDYTTDIELLKENIKDWASKFIGTDFEFREYQFDTIYDICLNILNGVNHTQIIEAPTGSGKSLLNIISAGVLAEYYDISSYILVSDLYLWKQYDEFINGHKNIKDSFGVLKGQTGNYTCEKNNEDMRNADCRMANISWAKLYNNAVAEELGYDCAKYCPYIKARKKALNSKVVVMTYQLYHFMINIVGDNNNSSSFKQRPVIFCDECHNIPKIITDCFTPSLRLSNIKHFKQLHSYKGEIKMYDLFDDNPEPTVRTQDYKLIHFEKSVEDIEKEYNKIFEILCNLNAPSTLVDEAFNKYEEFLESFNETVCCIESNLSYKKQELKQPFTQEEQILYKSCSWYRNSMCLWNDFKMCIEEIGIEYIVRSVSESKLQEEPVVTFTCVKEDYVVHKFLLSNAENRVMMSATLGGIEAFSENIGRKYLEKEFVEGEQIIYKQIPSTFDFSKSPIYFINRYKMSFKEKDQSLIQLKPIINKICSVRFPNERGMIQTGSYAIAKNIYDNAPIEIQQRMLLYNNAKEKSYMITKHQLSDNTILIGPTLVEGIDLPGDQCRFIIILKVPYPVIVDDYVKQKMKLFPLWYNSTTSNTIIQGIGRGNRYKEDYCITYILDACFLTLYNSTKSQYPKELQERIKIIV